MGERTCVGRPGGRRDVKGKETSDAQPQHALIITKYWENKRLTDAAVQVVSGSYGGGKLAGIREIM